MYVCMYICIIWLLDLKYMLWEYVCVYAEGNNVF